MKIKGVRLFLLRFQGNRALIYVYREKQLASRLNSPEADVLTPSDFDSSKISAYDAIAFGCPAMGAEVLEEAEFEPMWNECEGSLSGVKIALFGSYGWGDGEWMRTWECRCDSGLRQRDGQRGTGRRSEDRLPEPGADAGIE